MSDRVVHFGGLDIRSDRNQYPSNEDLAGAMVCQGSSPEGDAAVYYVCDGISNYRGDLAVRLIEKAIRPLLVQLLGNTYELLKLDREDREEKIFELLQEVIISTDQAICRTMEECGATISIAMVVGREVYTANLGDSPILLVEMNDRYEVLDICPLYTCQNRAGEELEKGNITHDQLFMYPGSNILSNAVLGEHVAKNRIALCSRPLAHYSLLLLGSDGGLAVLPFSDLAKIISEASPISVAEIVDSILTEVMNTPGATDNCTVIAQQLYVPNPIPLHLPKNKE